MKHARDINLTRESVLGTKLAPETPAFDVGQACGTGLEAAILVANKIALGQADSAIAGGSDTTSDAPIALNDDLREILLEANAARSTTDRIKALTKIRPSQIVPDFPRNAEPRTGLSMGEHTSLMAKEWGLEREEQDELAAASHQHLAAAYDRGFMDDLVSPYLGLERDGNLRPDATVESLGKLKPVFGGEDGTMTAGNSTPLSDGASAVLLGSEEWASAHGIAPLARFVDAEVAAIDYVGKKEGLLMAPAYAVPRMLERNGLSLQDFDLYEIHEAFAAQVLCTLKAWEDPVFCKQRLGLEAPLGEIDRSEAERERRLARRRPPIRRDGRADRRLARQGAGRARRGPWPDLDLRGRRPGRRRDPGTLRSQMPEDLYSQVVNSRIGGFVAGNVGLPQPVDLDRYEPGEPLIDGEVLLGAAPGGRLAGSIARVLAGAGVSVKTELEGEVRTAAGEAGLDAGVWNPDTANDSRFKALVFDASGIDDSVDLHALWEFFHPTIRAVQTSGRVVVLGSIPGSCGSPREATAQRALEGFTRAVGKEVRKGATAQLIQVDHGSEDAIDSTLRFVLSPRSAYVSGQVMRINEPVAEIPALDWDKPLHGKVALVTGASRGIGASIADVLSRDGAHVVGPRRARSRGRPEDGRRADRRLHDRT